MFDRVESFKKAIQDKNIDTNTLNLMIDFHTAKGTLSAVESEELNGLMVGIVPVPSDTSAIEDLLLAEMGV